MVCSFVLRLCVCAFFLKKIVCEKKEKKKKKQREVRLRKIEIFRAFSSNCGSFCKVELDWRLFFALLYWRQVVIMSAQAAPSTDRPVESVWDYPRPPRVEPTGRRIRVMLPDGTSVADSTRCYRILETSHPPVYYIPRQDIDMNILQETDQHTYCEWKGVASYFSIKSEGFSMPNVAWSYPEPTKGAFESIRDHIAFYPASLRCFVDDEPVEAQPGNFYGGWITKDIIGPFKGSPGTSFW